MRLSVYSMEIIKYHKLRCFPPKAYQNHAGIPPGKGKCVRKGRLRYSWSIFAIFRKHNRKLELRGRFSQKLSRKPSRERGKKNLGPLLTKGQTRKEIQQLAVESTLYFQIAKSICFHEWWCQRILQLPSEDQLSQMLRLYLTEQIILDHKVLVFAFLNVTFKRNVLRWLKQSALTENYECVCHLSNIPTSSIVSVLFIHTFRFFFCTYK